MSPEKDRHASAEHGAEDNEPGRDLVPPEATIADHSRTAMRALISAAPFIGGPATVLFDAVLKTPLEGRRDRWMETISAAFEEVARKVDGFSAEALAANDVFVSTMVSATSAAMRTHHEEKLEALRNGILNAALPGAPDDYEQQLFIGLVDSFTPWHLRVLAFWENPRGWYDRHEIPLPTSSGHRGIVLDSAFPELAKNADLRTRVLTELGANGLMQGGAQAVSMMISDMWPPLIEAWGKKFLRFIETPPVLCEEK